MSVQNGRAFNDWLRAQLKAKKMSQRQLAQQSGVDHSTISRLVRGDRTPSLGTATKLARGLRELRDESDTPGYFGVMAAGTSHPTARVEYALRADDMLSEPQVRQVMEYYLALRMRRLAVRQQPAATSIRCRRRHAQGQLTRPRAAATAGDRPHQRRPTLPGAGRFRVRDPAPGNQHRGRRSWAVRSCRGTPGTRPWTPDRRRELRVAARLQREDIRDAAHDDDREHTDGPVDERMASASVLGTLYAWTRTPCPLDETNAGRRERHGGQHEAMSATKKRR